MSSHFERWRADVESMITASQRAVSYCEGIKFEDFLEDSRTIDACVMNLIVLAEAAKGVPEDLKRSCAEVPWREISGFRNRAAHSNMTADLSLDLSIVWSICTKDLPRVLPHLEALLNKPAR